ncbi:MAG: ATP phosphoribosyltransferase regulatory subunit [Anaeroplasmataceae bacterium]
MKNYRLHTSEGVRDYLGEELLVKEEIEGRIKKLFLSYGYELVKTPTFEYIDVYTTNGIQQPSLYNLINRQGEVLALRNDMTSSIARIVASKGNLVFPKKYCYIANTFRYPRLYQGKSHEFTQAGIEIIGAKGIKADIECIRIASQALKEINLNNYVIHIGSSAFIDELFTDFGFDQEKKNNLLSIIEAKDYVLLKNTLLEYKLDSNRINLIIKLMEKAGKLNFLQGIIDELEGCHSVNTLLSLKTLYEELAKRGLIDKMVFDFSIYSYAKYYTGVTFQVFAAGIGRAIVTGGRCDNLLNAFSAPNSAIGFGLDIDACLEYIMANNLINITSTRYVSHVDCDSYEFAMSNNNSLREKGVIIDVSMYENLEDTLNYARLINCKKVLYYSNNTVKEIEVGEE